MMRDCCGSNDHPDSILFIQMYRLVSTYSLVKPPKGSNISGGEILDVLLSIKDITDADERWNEWTNQIDIIVDKGINCDRLQDATSLLEDHDYFSCSTSDYVLTYISGFVARNACKFITFAGKDVCEQCKCSLILDAKEAIPESHKLIELKSYGYLIHPSKDLFQLISLLEQGTLKATSKKELNAETLFDVTNAVENLPSTQLVGCKEHSRSLTHRIISFYLTMRMFFLCKQANKNDSVEREKTREKRKLAYAPDAPIQSARRNNEVSTNFKSIEPQIAVKPTRKSKGKVLSDTTNTSQRKQQAKRRTSVPKPSTLKDKENCSNV